MKRQYPSLDSLKVSDDSITNQSKTQMANSANAWYIAIVITTEPQSTCKRTHAIAEEPSGCNVKYSQLFDLMFTSGCNN